MADDRHYVPGSFYRIDDRTGFKVRADRTRKEWTGYIVRDRSWEPRQPQDFVRGVRDDQTVPDARPRQTDVFLTSTIAPSWVVSNGKISVSNASTRVVTTVIDEVVL